MAKWGMHDINAIERYTPERRQQLTKQVQALSNRDLQLWSLGFLVMLVLASGVLCFLLPNVRANFKVELRYVPQLSMGLISLVLLLNFYLIDKRRQLERTRQELMRDLALDEGFERFAVLDPATQVFCRSQLHQVLDRELRRASREDLDVTLLVIGYRCIRTVIPPYGDTTAEAFVMEVAQVLQQNFRGADRIVRYNDTEFVLVMTGTNAQQAEIACNRLQEYVDRWNIHTNMHCEMCLTTAAGEYRPGVTGPFELIGKLSERVAELAAAAGEGDLDALTAFGARAATATT